MSIYCAGRCDECHRDCMAPEADDLAAEVARLRALIFKIDNTVMNTRRPGDLYDAVRDLCVTEIVRPPQATEKESKT